MKMMHYIAWPDFGVPSNSQTLYKMANFLKNYESALVHCSAGVGRTGTFIALSKLIDIVESDTQYLNLFSVVLNLRKERPYMVRPTSLLGAAHKLRNAFFTVF